MEKLRVSYSDFRAGWVVFIERDPYGFAVSRARNSQAEAETLAEKWDAELRAGQTPVYEVLPSQN